MLRRLLLTSLLLLTLASLASAASSNVVLSWPSYVRAAPETGFRVWRKVAPATTFTLLATTAPAVLAYTDPTLAPGTYTYYVESFDATHAVKSVNEVNATVVAPSVLNGPGVLVISVTVTP